MLKQVLLVLCCIVAMVQSSMFPCLGAPAHLPHSFAASAKSCEYYVICMGGQEIHGQRCQMGLFFEPLTQTCGQSTCTDCSPFGIQNLPHPTDCNQFIQCVMGEREFRACPPELMFDRAIGNCNYPHLVTCPGLPPPTEPTDPITDPITYPTEEFTTVAYTTQPIYPTTAPWPINPTTQPPGGQLPVCIPGQVHHAHPYDCTRFFMCVNNVLWPGQCESGLHWNQMRNVCDLPEHAGCIHSTPAPGIPTAPPGEPPVTDPPLLPPVTPIEDEPIVENEFVVHHFK